jgi:hypothetical protein
VILMNIFKLPVTRANHKHTCVCDISLQAFNTQTALAALVHAAATKHVTTKCNGAHSAILQIYCIIVAYLATLPVSRSYIATLKL